MKKFQKLAKIYNSNRSIVMNILGAFFVKGGGLIISFFLFPAYIDFFEDQIILGVWYTLLSILQWILVFDLGLGSGLRNKLPECLVKNDTKTAKEYISTSYIIIISALTFVYLVGMCLISQLNWNSILKVQESLVSKQDLMFCVRIAFTGIVIYLILNTITSVLYAMQKAAFVNLLSLATSILTLIALLLIPSKDIVTNLKTMSLVNAFAMILPQTVCTLLVFCKYLKGCAPSIRFFCKKHVKDILGTGFSLFWLTLVFMVVSSTKEVLITSFTGPEHVVEYQGYYKIFNTFTMLVTLTLSPIWSAVTKAQIQKKFSWIHNVYRLFLAVCIFCFLIELLLIPIMQPIMDIWLGEGVLEVDPFYAFAFAISGAVMVLHNVNTSIGNGLSFFRIQKIWMTVAAVVYIPLSYVLVLAMESWIGVVFGGVICLLPYELIAPIYTIRFLKKHSQAKSVDS